MCRYLIIRLQGILQAWGRHTFETYRPTEVFPTRSGITGLIGACLGLTRRDHEGLAELDSSYRYGARLDGCRNVFWDISDENLPLMKSIRCDPGKLEDFHTVQDVRTVGGDTKPTEVTRREYLEDACFSVVLWETEEPAFGLDRIEEALRSPKFTPYLGRKSCPLGRPLFDGMVEAESAYDALSRTAPGWGILYVEDDPGDRGVSMRIRDVPRVGRTRQFDTRTIYVSTMSEGGGGNVSE